MLRLALSGSLPAAPSPSRGVAVSPARRRSPVRPAAEAAEAEAAGQAPPGRRPVGAEVAPGGGPAAAPGQAVGGELPHAAGRQRQLGVAHRAQDGAGGARRPLGRPEPPQAGLAQRVQAGQQPRRHAGLGALRAARARHAGTPRGPSRPLRRAFPSGAPRAAPHRGSFPAPAPPAP